MDDRKDASRLCGRVVEGRVCGKPALPGNPCCATCDLAVLIIARDFFPDAAAADFDREVPRPPHQKGE